MTYLELPFCIASPMIANARNYAWPATFLIPLNKLLNSHIICIHSLNCISEAGIIDLENVVLSAPVPIHTPVTQELIGSILGLHKVDLLEQLV